MGFDEDTDPPRKVRAHQSFASLRLRDRIPRHVSTGCGADDARVAVCAFAQPLVMSCRDQLPTSVQSVNEQEASEKGIGFVLAQLKLTPQVATAVGGETHPYGYGVMLLAYGWFGASSSTPTRSVLRSGDSGDARILRSNERIHTVGAGYALRHLAGAYKRLLDAGCVPWGSVSPAIASTPSLDWGENAKFIESFVMAFGGAEAFDKHGVLRSGNFAAAGLPPEVQAERPFRGAYVSCMPLRQLERAVPLSSDMPGGREQAGDDLIRGQENVLEAMKTYVCQSSQGFLRPEAANPCVRVPQEAWLHHR